MQKPLKRVKNKNKQKIYLIYNIKGGNTTLTLQQLYCIKKTKEKKTLIWYPKYCGVVYNASVGRWLYQ